MDIVKQTTSLVRPTPASPPPLPQQDATVTRADLVTRDTILGMLSEDEVAQVSMAETGTRLADGDEFVDLGRLDHGVQTAHGDLTVMARVLPKAAVRDATWAGIVATLHPTPVAVAGMLTER